MPRWCMVLGFLLLVSSARASARASRSAATAAASYRRE